MGEAESTRRVPQDRFSYNRSILVEGRKNKLTSDAGVLLLRELDEGLGLTESLAEELTDPRNPVFVTHPFVELLRTRLYALVQGHRDQDDIDRLRDDPAFRLGVSERRGTRPIREEEGLVPDGLSSQPTQSRLVATLTLEENLALLGLALFGWAHRDIRATRKARARRRVLDVDSLPIEAHGSQPGSARNGHYHMRCFHPIAVFDHESGHCLGGKLRPGNVSSADGVVEFLFPILDRVKAEGLAQYVDLRGDAGFPTEPLLAPLEAKAYHYAFRLSSNPVLERLAEPYLSRPPGRPPLEPRVWTYELSYRVTSGKNPWSRDRRVVLVVLEKPGELFLDHFFLVTNWTAQERGGEEILEFYRQRGTMEGYLGELKSVLQPALSSTNRMKTHIGGKRPKSWYLPRNAEAANEATFLLYLLAYNLLNAARRVANRSLPDEGRWSLDRVRTWLLNVPARVTLHGRYATFQINESAYALWQRLRSGFARLTPVLC